MSVMGWVKDSVRMFYKYTVLLSRTMYMYICIQLLWLVVELLVHVHVYSCVMTSCTVKKGCSVKFSYRSES